MLSIILAIYLTVGLIISISKVTNYKINRDSGTRLVDFSNNAGQSFMLIVLILFWPLHVSKR